MTRGHALVLSVALVLVVTGAGWSLMAELRRPHPASAGAMQRCSRLAAAGVRDAGCAQAWREARRRFLQPAAAR